MSTLWMIRCEEEICFKDASTCFCLFKYVDAKYGVQGSTHVQNTKVWKFQNSYKKYCSKDLVDAHSAKADTIATWEVIKAQVDYYEELENNIDFLSDFSKANKASVDYAGRIVLNDKKQPIINFGKHKGKEVEFVFKKEPGYYSWILKGDFSQNTKSCFTKLWEEYKSKKWKLFVLVEII